MKYTPSFSVIKQRKNAGGTVSRACNERNRKVEREQSHLRTGLRLPVVMPDAFKHSCLGDSRDLGEIRREREKGRVAENERRDEMMNE